MFVVGSSQTWLNMLFDFILMISIQMQNHTELNMLINARSGSEEHHDLHAYSFTVKKTNNLEQYFVLFPVNIIKQE